MTIDEAATLIANSIMVEGGTAALARMCVVLGVDDSDWEPGADVARYYRRKFVDHLITIDRDDPE